MDTVGKYSKTVPLSDSWLVPDLTTGPPRGVLSNTEFVLPEKKTYFCEDTLYTFRWSGNGHLFSLVELGFLA